MIYLRYLCYLLRHKFYVFLACCRMGIPWRGVVHDLSKFSPAEFGPYARNFFDPVMKLSGPLDPPEFSRVILRKTQIKADFQAAWLHHLHNNPHHHNYWVLVKEDGGLEALKMPEVYVIEMVADWKGAGMSINGVDDSRAFYEKTGAKMILHDETRYRVEQLLGIRSWSSVEAPTEDIA